MPTEAKAIFLGLIVCGQTRQSLARSEVPRFDGDLERSILVREVGRKVIDAFTRRQAQWGFSISSNFLPRLIWASSLGNKQVWASSLLWWVVVSECRVRGIMWLDWYRLRVDRVKGYHPIKSKSAIEPWPSQLLREHPRDFTAGTRSLACVRASWATDYGAHIKILFARHLQIFFDRYDLSTLLTVQNNDYYPHNWWALKL